MLELGSGTGLGGICISKLLETYYPDLEREVTLTDICLKSLEVLHNNLSHNGNLSRPELVKTKELAWGLQSCPDWAEPTSFDLIIASDVVYLPECVELLIQSVSHLLKPGSGRGLFVNCMLRTEPYLIPIEEKCAELGLTV